jgi:hypothetical protein
MDQDFAIRIYPPPLRQRDELAVVVEECGAAVEAYSRHVTFDHSERHADGSE